jgi:hypothetical protein
MCEETFSFVELREPNFKLRVSPSWAKAQGQDGRAGLQKSPAFLPRVNPTNANRSTSKADKRAEPWPTIRSRLRLRCASRPRTLATPKLRRTSQRVFRRNNAYSKAQYCMLRSNDAFFGSPPPPTDSTELAECPTARQTLAPPK